MFGQGIVHILAISIVTYLMMLLLPPKMSSKVVFFYVFGYLSTQHIYRMIVDFGGWKMDTTTFTMLLVCRCYSIACNHTDGHYKDEELH